MFRPQNVSIHLAGQAPGEDRVCLEGRVEHREFLGSLIRYAVRVGNHEIVVDDTHQRGVPAIEPGQSISLSLDTNNVLVQRT